MTKRFISKLSIAGSPRLDSGFSGPEPAIAVLNTTMSKRVNNKNLKILTVNNLPKNIYLINTKLKNLIS